MNVKEFVARYSPKTLKELSHPTSIATEALGLMRDAAVVVAEPLDRLAHSIEDFTATIKEDRFGSSAPQATKSPDKAG